MAQPVLDRVAAAAPARPLHPSHATAGAPHRAPAPRRRPAAGPAVELPPIPTDPRRPAPGAVLDRENQGGSAQGSVTVDVGTPAYGVRTVEARPGSESAIAVAARTADVIRLDFSVAVPSVGALARVVALVDEAVVDAGRDRAEVRVLLDLEVVLAGDDRVARRKRSQLEYLDALAGLTWSPADTRVVTTADRLVAEVQELARRAGVDGVVLHPLAGGAPVEAQIRTLVA